MAGVKISALPPIPSACALTDVYPDVQGGVTYKATLQQVLDLFQGKITSLGAQAAALNMNTHQINNVTDPTSAQDAATKNYVDAIAQGITVQGACYAGTTANLNATYVNGVSGIGATLTNAGALAAFSVDSVSPALNARILVKNQSTAAQNGIYTLTTVGSGAVAWVLTRATDYDQAAEINPGDLVVLTAGSTQANSSWLQTATVTTIGTDAISFSQFTASLPVNVPAGGTGITSATAYGLVTGGTTSTGAFQVITPGASGTILRSGGASALPAWTTTTYPATNAVNTIMYASSANVLGVITPANSSVLVSDSGGVPSWSTTLPAFTTSSITFNPTTGGIVGTTTNDNAAAGKVGEFVDSGVVNTNPTSSTVTYNITSISLTAGDWDVYGAAYLNGNAATVFQLGINTTTAALPTVGSTAFGQFSTGAQFFTSLFVRTRISIASTTTVYLVSQSTYGGSAPTVNGEIAARRVR